MIGNLTEALQLTNEMLELDPTSGIAQDNLEAIEEKLENPTDLDEDYEEPPKIEVMSKIVFKSVECRVFNAHKLISPPDK